MKKRIKMFICCFRALFIFGGIDWSDEKVKKDLERWKQICKLANLEDWKAMAWLLQFKPEFRNLLVYRNNNRLFFKTWIKIFYKPMSTLFIESEEIGGGLFIQHGFATMIAAKSIGENCWINQQVTIGYKGAGEAPVIGNNVMITCGAKVLGDIKVGNHAVIGANAVVVRDVEEGAVMGGVPAKKLK